jgi:undecaprenyl-diphosphatase
MSGIIEAVGRLDFATFQLLRLYHWPVLDIVMASLSDIAAGAGIWVALTLLIGLIHRRRWPAAIQALLAIALTIIFTESAVKPLVDRGRPFESYGDTRVYGYRPTTRSFPSGHAANAAAAAYALTRLAPEGRAIFWLIALLISSSRIYLGVHYPTDIIGGALIGLAVAKFVVGGTRWSFAELEDRKIGRLKD